MQRCLPPRSPEPAPKNYGSGGLLGMVFAGLGPAAAAVFTNPFDVAKVRMQLQGEALSGGARMYAGSFDCIYKTFKAEGIAGTQRGLLASVLREGSKNFFRIGLFHPILEHLHPHDHLHSSPPVWKRLLAGSISGAAGAVICNPIEIVKTRVQASSLASQAVGYQGYRYHGLAHAFGTIARNEGVKGLWTGTGISTIRSILATSANMTVNSLSKEKLLQDPAFAFLGFKAGALTDAVCAMLSGLACVAANNPADVVRTRLYNQPFKMVDGRRQGQYYPNMFSCASSILRNEGALAFWKGFVGHFMRTGPHYVVCFVFIGYLQRAALELKASANAASWNADMQAAFNKHAVGKSEWDLSSVESLLRLAYSKEELSLSDNQYSAAIRQDALSVLRLCGKGPQDRLTYGEFVSHGSKHLDIVLAARFS